MNTESKGRSWYDKFYSKFETSLMEDDTLASQDKASSKSSDDPPGFDSVRDEPESFSEDHCSDVVDREQPNQKCGVRLEEHSDSNQTATTTSLCRKDPLSSQASPHRSCNGDTVVNEDEFFIEDLDAAPLDTIDLYDMTFQEQPSDFDDTLLYTARDRTRQFRSFKRKIMDALTSKRRREKEYEQLAIWFGDADMGCDLIKTKEHATRSLDSNVPLASEDSDWELL